ncbi:MAG: hypothetical protein IT323_19730 [Anaerolineae bacterium]|nr:hypothetical protein [Anaerolineae bacterium]
MTIQDVIRGAKALSASERRELIKILVDTLTDEGGDDQKSQPERRPRSLLELAGLGAEMWRDVDAQEYVNRLRSEWDE